MSTRNTHTHNKDVCVCVGMSASRLALLHCFNFNSNKNNNSSKQQHVKQTNKRRRICYHKRGAREREGGMGNGDGNRRGGQCSDSVCMWKFHIVLRFTGYRPTFTSHQVTYSRFSNSPTA